MLIRTMQITILSSPVNSDEKQGCCQNWWFDLSMGNHANFRAWRWRNQEVWSCTCALYFFRSVLSGLFVCIYEYGDLDWSKYTLWLEHLPVSACACPTPLTLLVSCNHGHSPQKSQSTPLLFHPTLLNVTSLVKVLRKDFPANYGPLCSWRSHGTKTTILESKLHTGTNYL